MYDEGMFFRDLEGVPDELCFLPEARGSSARCDKKKIDGSCIDNSSIERW
jgi:hypothetical protein